ncbi:hypothetical protein AVEN_201574-1 [Araneus ventricosus]|uniref:Uncharacterized protein n=1 Tax=Araneus ventricosus TaxID=182803 RepID=A0A4Y2M4P7_ARAVE|nr:hypothetical protein AVEN_201574-1 [Araneus ventricosus]
MRFLPVLPTPTEIKPFPSPPKCYGISRFHNNRHRHVWCLGFSSCGRAVPQLFFGVIESRILRSSDPETITTLSPSPYGFVVKQIVALQCNAVIDAWVLFRKPSTTKNRQIM